MQGLRGVFLRSILPLNPRIQNLMSEDSIQFASMDLCELQIRAASPLRILRSALSPPSPLPLQIE